MEDYWEKRREEIKKMKCKFCGEKGYYQILSDWPFVDPYLKGHVPDYSDEHWKDSLDDWNKRWHKYWASPEYKEHITNLPSYSHCHVSEQSDYVKLGIYPCPECYFDNFKCNINQT